MNWLQFQYLEVEMEIKIENITISKFNVNKWAVSGREFHELQKILKQSGIEIVHFATMGSYSFTYCFRFVSEPDELATITIYG